MGYAYHDRRPGRLQAMYKYKSFRLLQSIAQNPTIRVLSPIVDAISEDGPCSVCYTPISFITRLPQLQPQKQHQLASRLKTIGYPPASCLLTLPARLVVGSKHDHHLRHQSASKMFPKVQ